MKWRSVSHVVAVQWAALVLSSIACLPAGANNLTIYGMWGSNTERYPSRAPDYSFGPPLFGEPPASGALKAPPIPLAEGGARPDIDPEAPDAVEFNGDYEPGSIVIDTARRRLYYVLAPTGALSYPVAVGKRGFAWTGVEKVSKVVDWPDWLPPEEMRARDPSLPLRMTGGVKNPLGAKAIYLGKTLYRIHGTNSKWSIGRAASSGCFRMLNKHVVHLSRLVDETTTVHVLRRLPEGVVADAEPAKSRKKKG